MKCEEMLAVLNEYVDGTVDPKVCTEFERHLADCHPCQIVVDTIRKTITLYREGNQHALPSMFQQRLHAALRQRWREAHPSH
jgi:anti-sigma factor RsiW